MIKKRELSLKIFNQSKTEKGTFVKFKVNSEKYVKQIWRGGGEEERRRGGRFINNHRVKFN